MLSKKGFIGLILVTLVATGLSGCGRGEEEQDLELPEEATEQEVNQFLEENEVTLSENAERANLSDPNGAGATGVATKEAVDQGADMTVLAALPELSEGSYYAWLKTGENEYVLIGSLSSAKGGYLIEKVISGELEGVGEVVVSKETQLGDQPTEIVLQGSF